MIRWFKKYFIPHEHNHHKPHILRRKATLFIIGIIFFIEALFLVQVFVLFPRIKFFAEIVESVLINETNGNRLADNLSSLKINPLLSGAAQAKADDMASKGYFAHTSPDGVTPWHWFQQVGYQYSYAGENLAINFSDSKDVVDAWMNSPGHRANILNNYFTDIGIGIAKGTYQGRETIFIVQMFGRPAEISVSVQVAPLTPPAEAPVPAVAPQPVALKPLQPAANPTDETQTFVAAENTSAPEVLPTETNSVSVNADTGTSQNLSIYNLVAKFVASPDTRTRYFYLVILGIISIALILNILIRVKIQHPRVILNGVILLLIINTVLIINQYLININGKIF